MQVDQSIRTCTAVLEHQLPMELRRPDAVLLVRGAVVILELKGEVDANDAAIDQAHAYARDLRNYHRSCHERDVTPVVVPTRMLGLQRLERNVHVCPVDQLDELINDFDSRDGDTINPTEFLSAKAYKPLPSLVTAARKLFFEKRPPQLWRSIANTDDAVRAVQGVIQEARATQTRRLVLLTGVPGAGKTLVGLRVAHAPNMCSAEADRELPEAIFLSGNGPLVDVLQYVLESKAFVRRMKDYVDRHIDKPSLVPNENVVIFDEAQRAHDADRVRRVHGTTGQQSDPELLIEFAERRPDWAVVVGLIGGGQEIFVGEEGGIGLWVQALGDSLAPSSWRVHGPRTLREAFQGLDFSVDETLNLGQTIRSHLATELHEYVGKLMHRRPDAAASLLPMAQRLEREGHDLRITRRLDQAKAYLKERYAEHPEARFGLVASSKDRDLERV